MAISGTLFIKSISGGAAWLPFCLLGCGQKIDLLSAHEPQPTITLTFDDGPLSAEQDTATADPTDPHLLDSLRSIVATLDRNGIQSVFYIKGPGSEDAAPGFLNVYGDALQQMQAAGQMVGYHAFRHDPAIWANPDLSPSAAVSAISQDLERLDAFLSESITGQGLIPAHVLTPVFRQPYGGIDIDQGPARYVAAQRNLVYHGFRIDSGDWIVNADAPADLIERLGVVAESQEVEFVRSRLRSGARQNRGRDSVDILFHVNSLTAAHLQDWIDALATDFAAAWGTTPAFEVSPSYLGHSDAFVDISTTLEILVPEVGR